jgi:transcriptional regulator with XRE-family HTH domain
MEQLGSIFKEARAKSNKTLDDASKETKIAKKYLLAIENEEFDVFPGETYLVGFMRNYAQFLGLDPDEIVLKYKDYKIQEQPAPIEQLTARPRNTRRYMVLAVIGAAILVVVITLLAGGKREGERIAGKDKKPVEDKKKSPQDQKGAKVFVFEEEEVIRNFDKNEIIEIPQKTGKYTIRIDDTAEKLSFSIGNMPFSASADERVEVDFDRDGRKDISLRVNELGEGSANITVKKLFKTDLVGSELKAVEKPGTGQASAPAAGKEKTAGPPEVVITKEEGLPASIPVAPKTGFQILTSYEKTGISTQIKGASPTYLGYSVDKGPKKESVVKNGDQIDFTARDEVKLMVSNAQGVTLEINKVPVPLGERGQVVAKSVRWYRDAANKDLYYLILDNVEE